MARKPQVVMKDSVYRIGAPEYTDYSVDAPYHDNANQGYATHLDISPVSTPDAQRVGQAPLRETNFHRAGSAEEFYAAVNEPWLSEANAAEHSSPQPMQSEFSSLFKRFQPRPLPGPPDRWTAYRAPSGYSFFRKFGSNAREFTGIHFSMADHRRNFPILGMEPVRKRRNTDRLTPQPHDAFSKDQAPDPVAPIAITPVQQVFSGTRSYRL